MEIYSISKIKRHPPIAQALRENSSVRARAALALTNIGDARIIPDLFPLLKIKMTKCALPLVLPSAKFKDPSTFDELANPDDAKIEVRQAAAVKALGDTQHRSNSISNGSVTTNSFWWF